MRPADRIDEERTMYLEQLDTCDEMYQVLYERLSNRELEVLTLVSAGETNRKIAQLLQISGNTVKSHVKHIFNKLGVQNRTQAAVKAARLNLIEMRN
jgi:ATP/maltotriose-dependent transcriptional regulator MalT